VSSPGPVARRAPFSNNPTVGARGQRTQQRILDAAPQLLRRRRRLDGDLPVNPHGGQLSEGRTHGFGFLYEAMAQLRHEAGERQVTDARTAVVTSGGGTPSGVLLLRRDG